MNHYIIIIVTKESFNFSFQSAYHFQLKLANHISLHRHFIYVSYFNMDHSETNHKIYMYILYMCIGIYIYIYWNND